MTRLEYVACCIRDALQVYDLKKHGNYSIFLAKVALSAAEEPIPKTVPEPAPANTLDALFA